MPLQETTFLSSPNSKSWKTISPHSTSAHPGAESRFLFGFSNGDGLIERFLTKFADIQMEQRLVITAIALKRYQLRQGKYPARLQDLTPGYLSEIPLDPMDGKPLRYQPKPGDTFLLYSVGEDSKGQTAATPARSHEETIKLKVYKLQPWLSEGTNQLWLKARDAVWPLPANRRGSPSLQGQVPRRLE